MQLQLIARTLTLPMPSQTLPVRRDLIDDIYNGLNDGNQLISPAALPLHLRHHFSAGADRRPLQHHRRRLLRRSLFGNAQTWVGRYNSVNRHQ